MRRRITVTLVLGLVIALTMVWPSNALGQSSTRTAWAHLMDPAGQQIGFARFYELRGGQVFILVHATGLTPGLHGMHVHTTGACSPDFAAAGGHFNPTGGLHGSHAGDLGNLSANAAGLATTIRFTQQFTLSAGQFSLFDADGSALVIHAGEDDLVTDPTGNSGARLACGVIQTVESPN